MNRAEKKHQRLLLLLLVIGLVLFLFPLYIIFVSSTHSITRLLRLPLPVFFSDQLFNNFSQLLEFIHQTLRLSFARVLVNSFVLALGVSLGKILIAFLTSFALVYFNFRGRQVVFWFVLLTLMLPIEIRLFATYELMSKLNLLNSYVGLILPLIASATATFFLRQYLQGVPDSLCEAAKIDGATPIDFLLKVLLPISQTALASIFVLMFIYGWNQYLWPLLITTKVEFYPIFIVAKRMVAVDSGDLPSWHLIMLLSSVSLLPPLIVMLSLKRYFIRFFISTC